MASACLASEAKSEADEVGIGHALRRRAVFLDRDGVINRAVVRNGRPHPPESLDHLEIIPGVGAALWKLRQSGYLNVIVTNQPDVARGKTDRLSVEMIHRALQSQLPIDVIYTCWHDDADRCECRKPAPGLLLQAAEVWGINLSTSYMVGDRWRDILAGQRAGCRTAWIRYDYAEESPSNADFVASDLAQVADWILRERNNEEGLGSQGQNFR